MDRLITSNLIHPNTTCTIQRRKVFHLFCFPSDMAIQSHVWSWRGKIDHPMFLSISPVGNGRKAEK